jgi:flagellar hook-associated protein 1 FlgK
MGRLDALAKGLVQTVNSIHSSGQVYTGNPPVASPAGNFFDVTNPPPAGGDPLLTARNIRLASTMTGPSAVATAGASATGPGNTDVATQLAALHDTVVTFTDGSGTPTESSSFDNFYQNTVGGIATATQQSGDDATVQQTLASNADTRRQSVSGVSTDEELISVIQHQQAYSAAARLVSVVSQMSDTLVTLGQ